MCRVAHQGSELTDHRLSCGRFKRSHLYLVQPLELLDWLCTAGVTEALANWNFDEAVALSCIIDCNARDYNETH
jgi:hypothetical protein